MANPELVGRKVRDLILLPHSDLLPGPPIGGTPPEAKS